MTLLPLSYVYGLCDPRNDEIRYVGQTTTTLERRLAGHIRGAKYKRLDPRTHKNWWILGLLTREALPSIHMIESGHWSGDELDARELYWYEALLGWGARLTNAPMHRYGNGFRGDTQSEDTKALMRASHQASWLKDSEQGSPRRAALSRPKSEAHKQKIANAIKALWDDPVYVAKFEAGVEAKRALQTAPRVLNVSDEGRAKRRESMNTLASRKRHCNDCGLVCSPGNMGRHQKVKGHVGYANV